MAQVRSQFIESTGDNTVVQMAAGDIVYGDKTIQQDPEFFEPELEYVRPPNFESPAIAEELTTMLDRRRVLILGGSRLLEKSTFAHHLAWRLSDANGQLLVQEWIRSSVPPKLNAVFQNEKTPTIFILPRIQPFHVEHNPERLCQAVERTHHFVLMTTDTPRSQWALDDQDPARQIWRELSARQLYSADYLGLFLRKALAAVQEPLPEGVLPQGLPEARDEDLDRPLVEDLSVRDAARQLETPDRIRSLVRWLIEAPSPLRAARVRQQIEHLHGDKASIRRWYRQLDRRQQLLALGLALFDGLLDDQLFAALEILVDHVWRPRDPFLAAFDYQDLEALSGYFKLTETDSGGFMVESNSFSQRQAVFEVAWQLHRRQILATLPVITRLIKDSGDRSTTRQEQRQGRARQLRQVVSEAFQNVRRQQPSSAQADDADEDSPPENEEATGPSPEGSGSGHLSRWLEYGPARELFGSKQRKERLYGVVSESLSHLGLLSLQAVERCLLELASDGAREVQAVAARAMAKWREHEQHERLLFQILHQWQNESAMKDLLTRLFLGRRNPPSSPYSHIRATVALVVSYAALHDRPNELASDLYRLVEKLADEPHPMVRSRFRDQTLPLVITGHRRQLEPALQEIVLYTDLIFPIAFGWAKAYELRPQEARELLENWYRECMNQRAVPENAVATRREAMLATVALTYGYMDYKDPESVITADQAFSRLKAILKERHPFVRSRVLQAMVFLTLHSLEKTERQIRELLDAVSLEERGPLVGTLKNVYVEQRAALTGGDDEINVRGRFFQVWRDRDRPLTEVEKVLRGWVLDDSHPQAQQIALEALTAFHGTALDQGERDFLASQEKQQPESAAENALVPIPQVEKLIRSLRETTLLDRMAIRIITLGKRQYSSILCGLVPEFVHQRKRRGQETQILLDRWRRTTEDTFSALGRYLNNYARYYKHRTAIHFSLVSASLLLIILILIGIWR